MSKSKQASDQELIDNLRYKIKELEHEVSTLKGRLDGLRKAKNTTVTKREREIVEIGFKRDPHYEAKIEELERKLREKATNSKELQDLKKQHAEEIGKLEAARRSLKEQLDELYKKMEAERTDLLNRIEKLKKDKTCDHESEIYKLKTRIADLEGDNAAIKLESSDLKDRVNSLCLELSVKEAKWCEKEEQYKLKLKSQWGDKYAEWMRETETKIQELQETNNMLRMYLHRSGQRLPDEANRGAQS